MAKTTTGKELRKTFELWGLKWETCMEGERPLHPSDSRYYINQDNVVVDESNEMVTLTMEHNPADVNWFQAEWRLPKIDYTSQYSCGLIKSVDTVKVNSIMEAELKFPKGANLWPSFWLTACDSWPPEIDIVEAYTNNKGSYKDGWNFHWQWPFFYRELRFESNIHYKGDKEEHKSTGARAVHPKVMNKPVEDSWNNFKCIWTDDVIEFYINGHLVRKITDKYVLAKMATKGMWVIFNIWPNKVYNNTNNIKHEFQIRNFKTTPIK